MKLSESHILKQIDEIFVAVFQNNVCVLVRSDLKAIATLNRVRVRRLERDPNRLIFIINIIISIFFANHHQIM